MKPVEEPITQETPVKPGDVTITVDKVSHLVYQTVERVPYDSSTRQQRRAMKRYGIINTSSK